MPETYVNIPLFISQMKIILPLILIVIVGLLSWVIYMEKKKEGSDE